METMPVINDTCNEGKQAEFGENIIPTCGPTLQEHV